MRCIRARGFFFSALIAVSVALLPGLAGAAGALDSLVASPALDLGLLERAVLESNASLAAARASWEVARIHASHEGSWEDPALSFNLAPRTLFNSSVETAYRLELSQLVPIFGRRGLAREAGWYMADAAHGDYRAAALDLLTAARRAYFDFYLAGRGGELNRELADVLTQVRSTALARYSAGTSPLQDGLQAEAELAMLDHDRLVYERQRRGAQITLNYLLHRSPGDSLPAPPDSLPVPATPEHVMAAGGAARPERPDVQRARAELEATRVELELARRYRLPGLTLMGGYDRTYDIRQQRLSVGAAVNLPLNFGRIRAHEQDFAAQVRQAEWKLASARDRVAMDVADADQRAHESLHELEVLRGSVIPATAQALEAVRSNYQAGRTDFQSVLGAERAQAQARFSYFRAFSEYQQARAELSRAAGDIPALPDEVKP